MLNSVLTDEKLFQGLNLFVLWSASHRGGVKIDLGVGEHLWIRIVVHGQEMFWHARSTFGWKKGEPYWSNIWPSSSPTWPHCRTHPRAGGQKFEILISWCRAGGQKSEIWNSWCGAGGQKFDTWRPVALWSRPVEGWRRWRRKQAGDLMRPDFSFGFLVMLFGNIQWKNFSHLRIYSIRIHIYIYVVWSADVGLQRGGTVVVFHDDVVRNKK